MNIYIEDAIFDTTAINSVILFLSLFSLRQKIKWLKIIAVALFGCVFSIVLTFFSLPNLITIFIKILCGIIMSCLVIENFSIKKISLFFLVFLSFTFLIGGFCFFIIYLLGGEIYSLVNLTYNLPISLGVLSILIGIYVYFLVSLIKIFYKKQRIETFNYKIKLKANNKKIVLSAYLDSGNLLQEPDSGKPIIIINSKIFLKLFKDKVTLVDCVLNNLNKKIEGKYIKFNTIGKSGNLFVFSPNSIELLKDCKTENTKFNALVGVSLMNNNFNNFEALLNPLCF